MMLKETLTACVCSSEEEMGDVTKMLIDGPTRSCTTEGKVQADADLRSLKEEHPGWEGFILYEAKRLE